MTKDTLTLVIDTAADVLSVAVLDGSNKPLAHHEETVWRDMAARLQPEIASVLKEARAEFRDISQICVNLGPGSFTSIRIGLAAVKALSFALAIPAYGANGLEALARPYFRGKKPVFVCLKAVGRDVYCQRFGADGKPAADAKALPMPEALAQCPAGAVLLTNTEIDQNLTPPKAEVKKITAAAPADIAAVAKGSGHSADLSPVYVRPLTYKKQIA